MSHDHGYRFIEKVILKDGFSFHSYLSEWLLEYTNLTGELLIEVLEASCGESNCPVEETKLTWAIDDKPDFLRLGRGREKILKQDVYLSWKKKKAS